MRPDARRTTEVRGGSFEHVVEQTAPSAHSQCVRNRFDFPGEEFDAFGNAIAVHGNMAVIGASWTGANEGAAYVFQRSDADWSPVAKLAPQGVPFDTRFGYAVAIAQDVIAVGAHQETTDIH